MRVGNVSACSPSERAWNQYQAGGEPSGDRHDADEQPRRSHTFTNVSSTAATASRASRQRDDNEDVAGGHRPAPALDVEGEGERVGGELDRAVRERGASHPRAVGAEAHADHHHVRRDATGERDLAARPEHPLGAPGLPLRGPRGRASAPPAVRHRWPAARGGCARRPLRPRWAGRGRPRSGTRAGDLPGRSRRCAPPAATVRTASVSAPAIRAAIFAVAASPASAVDCRCPERATMVVRVWPTGARLDGCSSQQRSEDRLDRHLGCLDRASVPAAIRARGGAGRAPAARVARSRSAAARAAAPWPDARRGVRR